MISGVRLMCRLFQGPRAVEPVHTDTTLALNAFILALLANPRFVSAAMAVHVQVLPGGLILLKRLLTTRVKKLRSLSSVSMFLLRGGRDA